MTNRRRIDLCAACRKRCQKKQQPTPCTGCKQANPPLIESNTPRLKLMSLCSTQWRVGINGPYGLDYPTVFKVAELHGLELDADTFAGLQVLEDEQLVIWAEQRPKKED